jgi:lipoyl(octanoyl) transferase
VNDLPSIAIRRLGNVDYAACFAAMKNFTAARTAQTPDEIWLVEHERVFTVGLRGRHQSFEPIGGIPVVHTDRGGDLTYHGPGQLVAYLLMDLARLKVGPKALVQGIEDVVIDTLRELGMAGARRAGAPGVYVNQEKIASLGLRIKDGKSYHGVSLNVDMDLSPFSLIAPCGIEGLRMTQLRAHGVSETRQAIENKLAQRMLHHFTHFKRAA